MAEATAVRRPKQSERLAATLNSPPETWILHSVALRKGMIPGSRRWTSAPRERKSMSACWGMCNGLLMCGRCSKGLVVMVPEIVDSDCELCELCIIRGRRDSGQHSSLFKHGQHPQRQQPFEHAAGERSCAAPEEDGCDVAIVEVLGDVAGDDGLVGL